MQTVSLSSLITVPIQQVIYLGAGIAQELPALLELNAETIYLVEGDAEHQALLESEIECYPQVKLVKKLLSDRTGSATFYRYSLSELNSLQEGNGLQQLFPNVRLVEQQARQTENLVEWLNTLQLQQRDNLIWIDLPGQEAIIIRHLIEHQQLDLFDTLILYAHQQPCYEGQQSIDQIREMLADQGYEVQQQNNDVDPDCPLLVMQRHSLYWENRELQITVQDNKQHLFQANELIAKLAEEKQQISSKLNQLVSEKEALASSQTELEKLLAELRKESEQSAKAKQEKITALEAQLLEVQKSAAASTSTIHKLKAELDNQAKEKLSLNDKLNRLKQDKDTLEENNAELEKTLNEKLRAAIQSAESKQASITQLQTELTESKQLVQMKAEKLQQLEKQLSETQQSGKVRQEKITALEAQLAEVQKISAASTETATKLKTELEIQAKEKHALSDKLSQLAKEKETLENNKAELEKTLNEKLRAASQSAESKQATITQLQTELTETKQLVQAKAEKQQQLEKQLSETQQSAMGKQEKVTALEAQLVEAQTIANTNKEAINTLKEENTALTKRRNELKKQLEEAQQKIQLLETQINTTKETQHGLSELQKHMEYLFNQNRLQLEQAANALGQHITHTGKQTAQEMQTFVQCQQTLGQNTQALHYQDQSLSPEFALYLNQKLTHGYYDVILVMGSGVLTQFVATQLQQGLQQHPRLGHQEPSSDQGYVMPDQGDLPKRILAFEHKKSDSKDLKKHLQQNGYQTWVNVSHAPLVECRFSGKDYLYYDLRKPLSRLADVYEERHAKILILVSPSQVSESLTTEACLPALLQELSMHQLELVLHPVNKHIESLKSAWQSLLDSRDLEYTWVEDTHINAAQLTVNP